MLHTDINPGPESSEPWWLVPVGDRLVFSAFVPGHGRELLVVGGKTPGDVVLKDLRPGPGASDPCEFTFASDRLFFAAFDAEHGRELWLWPLGPVPSPFRRGDASGDDRFDLSDSISILAHVFWGGEAPGCLDAADVDDSGAVDIGDPVYSLSFLFLGGSAPASPFAACGFDGSTDGLDCGSPPDCR